MNVSVIMNIIQHPKTLLTKINYRYPFLLKWMSDEQCIKFWYKYNFWKKLDLENPQTFNEKLQWLKLYDRDPLYTTMVDKLEAKRYVAEKIGEQYIIPTLGVWDNFDDIDFDKLPNQFVLKCTHDSGGLVICRDKSKLDKNAAKKKINRSLKRNFYWVGREWPYKNVRPRIIAEKFMSDESGELQDFKVHNFNGVPKVVLVCSERFSDSGLHEDFYNISWKKLDLKRPTYPQSKERIEQPAELKKMLDLSANLSKQIPFARTDFYSINGNLYFGEITFFPASGFEKFVPETWDADMGNWIVLPVDKNSGGGYNLKNDNICIWIHSEDIPGLTDYKFFCFNGYVDCVMVCIDRSIGDAKFYFFDQNWTLKRLNIRGKNAPTDFTLPKPRNIDEMFDIASKLSGGLPFSRIDLYECNGQVYFGEITFFPDSGFDANLLEETDKYFGEKIKLKEMLR